MPIHLTRITKWNQAFGEKWNRTNCREFSLRVTREDQTGTIREGKQLPVSEDCWKRVKIVHMRA